MELGTHLLNSVLIRFGTVNTAKETTPFSISHSDFYENDELTMWGVLKVPELGLFFSRDYVKSAWKVVDFANLEFSEGADKKTVPVSSPDEPFAIVSSLTK